MRIFILLAIFLLGAFPSHAKTVADFCQGIKNTTDLTQCLNAYHEKSRLKLAQSYQEVFDALPDNQARLFKQTQQSWIQYRNGECDLAVHKEDTQSLKRVRELHCLIRMNANRQSAINSMDMDLQAHNEAQGMRSRWENILSADFPRVFWQTGQARKMDLNCNNQPEHALLGIHIDQSDNQSFVVGFIENTKTGRPKPLLLALPFIAVDDEDELVACGHDITFTLPDRKADEECENETLTIQNGECGIFEIGYEKTGFAFKRVLPENTDNAGEDMAVGNDDKNPGQPVQEK